MATKRIRIFAGPNGSGKSSIFKILSEQGKINFGVFVNADEIERCLKERNQLNFSKYQLDLTFDDFIAEFSKSSFYALSNGAEILQALSFNDNTLFISDATLLNSYFAAFISDFIRVKMLDSAQRFTIETVMSHKSKLDYIKLAKEKGFRIYLYFVSTRDFKVNIGRVEQRVALGGHNVSEEKIEKRYYNSLENLKEATLLSDRAYIFDNSGDTPIWYAEYDSGNLDIKYDEIPAWITDYLL